MTGTDLDAVCEWWAGRASTRLARRWAGKPGLGDALQRDVLLWASIMTREGWDTVQRQDGSWVAGTFRHGVLRVGAGPTAAAACCDLALQHVRLGPVSPAEQDAILRHVQASRR